MTDLGLSFKKSNIIIDALKENSDVKHISKEKVYRALYYLKLMRGDFRLADIKWYSYANKYQSVAGLLGINDVWVVDRVTSVDKLQSIYIRSCVQLYKLIAAIDRDLGYRFYGDRYALLSALIRDMEEDIRFLSAAIRYMGEEPPYVYWRLFPGPFCIRSYL